MCIRPIKLNNKYYNPDDPHSSPFLTLPCGKCEECSNLKVSNTLFRASYQHIDVINRGGYALFVTLTFNFDHLNEIQYRYTNDNNVVCYGKMSTWNNKHFKRWSNALNTYLERNHCEMSYLCTAERGSNDFYLYKGKLRQATSRPHYHVIVWVVPKVGYTVIDQDTVMRKLVCYWSDKSRGNTCLSSFDDPRRMFAANSPIGYVYNELLSRTESEAIKYVVKYCFKNQDEPLFKIHEEQIISSRFELDYNDLKPTFRQSHYIGVSFELQYDFTDPSCIPSLFDRIHENPDGEKIVIPRYYIKRHNSIQGETYTEYIVDERRTFSSKGVDHHPYKFEQVTPLVLKQTCISTYLHPIFSDDGELLDLFDTGIPSNYQLFPFGGETHWMVTFEKASTFIREVLTTHYREVRHKHQIKNKFGKLSTDYNLDKNIKQVYESFHYWCTENFVFENEFPHYLAKEMPDTLLSSFLHLHSHLKEYKDIIISSLSSLSYDEFATLFRVGLHIDQPTLDCLVLRHSMLYPTIGKHCRTGRVIRDKEDEYDYYLELLPCIETFKNIRFMFMYLNSLNSHVQLRAAFAVGIHEAVKARPHLFEPKLV